MRLRLFLLVAALAACSPARPKQVRRVGEKIGETFKQLNDAHRFSGVIPPGWTVDHFATTGERVELGFVDAGGAPHIVELLPEPPPSGHSDGRGHLFEYRLIKGGDGASREALLAAANLVDGATPSDALLTFTIEPPSRISLPGDGSSNPRDFKAPPETMSMPKKWALPIAGVESLIMIVAIVAAVVIPLRRRPTE